LIFLSDGVFAIAMTLLVVELVVPSVIPSEPSALVDALLALRPKYLSFGISFVVIASYWTSHQRIFSSIVRCDGRRVWLNLLLLLCIAFQPFPTNVLGTYGSTPAVTLHAGTLAFTGSVVLVMWLYATTGHRLVRADLDARLIRHHTLAARKCGPCVFGVNRHRAGEPDRGGICQVGNRRLRCASQVAVSM